MKNLKKVLAFVTMLTMLLSVAVSAGSLYPDVADDASYAEAVETLNALGIMIGDEQGNFNPDASITRAETAAIVTRMKALVVTSGGTNFTDVAADHWAAGYINCAEQSGIINGYGDGTFGPSDAVTFEQVIKMIVAALGRTPEAESLGGYPSGYSVVAARENITSGVSITAPGAEAPRAAVARLVFNALEVDVMEQTGFKKGEEEWEVKEDKTLLKDYLKVNKIEGIVEDTYLTATTVDPEDDKIYLGGNLKINGYTSTSDKYDDTIADAVEAGLAEGKTNAAAFLGYWVSAYAAVDEETDEMTLLGIAKKAGKNSTIELNYSQVEAVAFATDKDGNATDKVVEIEYYETETSSRETKIEVAENAAYYFNNGINDKDQVEEFVAKLGTDAPDFGELTLIDYNNDDVYDVVMLKQESANYVVATVNASAKSLDAKDGSTIDIDIDDEDVITKFYKADGSAASFEDIKEGDVLTLYNNSSDTVKLVYISDVKVEGTVKEKDSNKGGDDAFKIGDTFYYCAKIDGDFVSVSVGDEGTFYINAAGRIVAKDATAASGNYAYLYKALSSKVIDGATVELKYLTSEGTWETKNLATKVNVSINGASSKSIVVENAVAGDFGSFLVLNGETWTDNTAEDAFNTRLFQYKLDASGDIKYLYIGSAAANNEDALSLDKSIGMDTDRPYDASQKKLGSIYFNDESKIFSVKLKDVEDKDGNVVAKNQIVDEDDVTLTKVSALFTDNSDYSGVFAYDIKDNAPAITVAYNAGTDILSGTKLFVLNKVSDIHDENGAEIKKLYGYQEGQAVEGETSDDVTVTGLRSDINYIEAGDVAIFSLDGNGKINNIEILMTNAKADDMISKKETMLTVNGDKHTADYFAFAQKKQSGLLYLTKDSTKTSDTNKNEFVDGNGDQIAMLINGKDVNVYEVNLKRDPATYQVISYGDIDTETRAGKDGHWIYIREYDEAVVDVVVYKVENPTA